MYHSIDFFYEDPIITEDNAELFHINTWDDWKIISEKTPVITPPETAFNIVSIPGRQGFINVSEILTGYPIFGSRKGSIDFIILNKWNTNDALEFNALYSKIASALHGRELRMVLEDDPNYYYIGVFSISSIEPSTNTNGTITIDYELQPYKWARTVNINGWLWDPFDFENGIIPNNIDITVTEEETRHDLSGIFGDAPVTPVFVFKDWVGIQCIIEFTCDYSDGKRDIKTLEIHYSQLASVEFCGKKFNVGYIDPTLVITAPIVIMKVKMIGNNDITASCNLDILFKEGKM